jgi:hypothetical protein
VILKDGMRRKMFSRRVANVGSPNSIYSVEVMAPHGEDTQQIQKVNRHPKIFSVSFQIGVVCEFYINTERFFHISDVGLNSELKLKRPN